MVDGATSEWITMVSGVLHGSVLGHLLFVLYTSEMLRLLENRLYAYTNDSTLLAVVRRPASSPAVAASDLTRIHVWCNHWLMILHPPKNNALVICRSRTVNPPHGDLVLSGVSICAVPSFDILSVKFDRKLTHEDHVRGIVSCVSARCLGVQEELVF